MKTYKKQHLVFKIRYFIKLGLNRDFLSIWNYLKLTSIKRITALFGINRKNKSTVNIRYFYRSKAYREVLWQSRKGNHSRVIDIISSMPNDALTPQLKQILKSSSQTLNLFNEILKNQDHIFDDYIKSLPDKQDKDYKTRYKNVVRPGASHAGIIVESKDGIEKKITKVINFYTHPINCSTEHYFYRFLSVGRLEKFIPKFYEFTESKKEGFLTIEYIHGRTPQASDIHKVLKFQKEMFQIDYQYLHSLKSMKPVLPYILFNPQLLPFDNNQVLRRRINQIIKNLLLEYSIDKNQTTTLFKNIYLTPPIYDLIDFKKDLRFQHRDFGPHNSIINNDNNLKVFDWEGLGLAVPGTDILGFMMVLAVDFEEIQNTLFEFIQKENINNYDVICAYLTLMYLSFLINQENTNKKEANALKAIQFLTSSPLNS